MGTKRKLVVTAAASCLLTWTFTSALEKPSMPVVRIAELRIDPAQPAAYTTAVKEEMDASVRLEPGVLALYAVAEKDDPASLRFFEIYADETAYRAHIQSRKFPFLSTRLRSELLLWRSGTGRAWNRYIG